MLAKREDRYSQLLARRLQHEHRGQYLVTSSNLSAEEHAELASLAPTAHAAFREELDEATRGLRALLAPGDPLYITAILQLTNILAWGGTYYEPTERGGEHKVELIAGLLCTQPVADDLDGPSDAEMQGIHDEIDHILEVLLLFNHSMPPGEDIEAASLRFKGAMQWMMLRGDSYGHHGEELARALYSPHDGWMLETYGFTVDDVLMLGATVTALTENRINALLKDAHEFSDGVMKVLRSKEGRAQLSADAANQLGSREGEFQIRGAALIDYFQAGVRQAATVSADEVCAESVNLPPQRVEAMLGELSIPVGSLELRAYTGLFDESPLVERPFLEFGGRYLLAVPGMVLRDAVALLEDRFMRGKAGFSKSRARTLDVLAVEYLASMLPGAAAYTHLFYEGVELDGLVLFEDVAFVVEGKGSSLSVQGHRGDVRRLVSDIRDAVACAWEQGARARAFILGGEAVFRDEAGTEVVRTQRGSIKEVFIVNPTLHELGGHAPQLARLRAQGLFPDRELPWSVYINDLRVISETSDNAAVFLHYLVWRARLPLGEGVVVSDELDLWGCYRLCEQFGMLADNGIVVIGNSSTDFDAYYDGLLGHGPKKRRPRKFLREPVKAFVDRMATERPLGWRDAAGVCLDMSLPELAFVCDMAPKAARSAAREGMPMWANVGRVALVGIPKHTGAESVPDQVDPENEDPTLIVYAREASRGRAEIVWAKYGRPVTFQLSEFERSMFDAPDISPFRFEQNG